MATYDVDTTTIDLNELSMMASLLESAIEHVLLTKTITYIDILPVHRDRDECLGILVVHETPGGP